MVEPIPFNAPQLVGQEHQLIDEALADGRLSGNGRFSQLCAAWLEERLGAAKVLITPSCTAALEMTALLTDLQPGDEVIVPSFTFVSTANAFALRGAVPVFVDIDPVTFGLSPEAVADAVTERTRAIVVVHYGGIAVDMDAIMAIAGRHGLLVIEDAAHSLPASQNGRPLGSVGHMSTFSFHETKNVQCGEGGALVVNDPSLCDRAEIIQEKGTNRAQFFRGQTDKYTWRDLGSSYLLSEVSAAFLWGQLQQIDTITAARRHVWARYHSGLAPLAQAGLIEQPTVPTGCEHSGHLYYLLVAEPEQRDEFIRRLANRGVMAVFHYVPLHSSPAGQRFGRASGAMTVTEDVSSRLIRLPMWAGLSEGQIDRVISAVTSVAQEVSGIAVAR